MLKHLKIINLTKNIASFYKIIFLKEVLEQPINSPSLRSITLLPHRWNNPLSKQTSPFLETNLGVITLLGWIGYTTLDHAIDGQHNILKYIPLAERCMRELHWRLALLCKTKTEQLICTELISLIETAHKAECGGKVPPPWHKSAGHMIGPLLITIRQGYGPKSATFKAAKIYFIEFLTIKQLSDDLRDFEEDFKAGRNTVVTKHLKKLLKARPLKYSDKSKISFHTIRQIFTQHTLKHFCTVLIHHGDIALKALPHTGIHRDAAHFKDTIIRLQTGARNALHQIQKPEPTSSK